MSKRKRRRNLWPLDAFKKTTVYHLRGRSKGVKESSTSRYKGHAIYKHADGYTVPSLDTSVFDDKREAKRFIDAMKKYNPKRKRNLKRRTTKKALKARYGEDAGRMAMAVKIKGGRVVNPTFSLPRNKFINAKVRMKGGKIQMLVDESLLGHAGASGHLSLNPRRRKAKRKTARRRNGVTETLLYNKFRREGYSVAEAERLARLNAPYYKRGLRRKR